MHSHHHCIYTTGKNMKNYYEIRGKKNENTIDNYWCNTTN